MDRLGLAKWRAEDEEGDEAEELVEYPHQRHHDDHEGQYDEGEPNELFASRGNDLLQL